jgi:flagellar basal-body rod protein FlgF
VIGPFGAKITLSEDGSVMASDPSKPSETPTEVDRLKLVSYAGTQIEKDLTGMFRVPNNGVLPTDDTAKVTVGALEGSNVKPTEVMVEMVEAQRSFDMRTKLIATAKEIDQGGASLMRMTSG